MRVLLTGSAGFIGSTVHARLSAAGHEVVPVDLMRPDGHDVRRAASDPAWPALAAQLREITGTADRPTVLATAALALGQVQQIIAAVHGTGRASGPPATLNATLEVDVGSPGIVARRWGRHPLCGCWESVSDTSWDRSLTAAADQA